MPLGHEDIFTVYMHPTNMGFVEERMEATPEGFALSPFFLNSHSAHSTHACTPLFK